MRRSSAGNEWSVERGRLRRPPCFDAVSAWARGRRSARGTPADPHGVPRAGLFYDSRFSTNSTSLIAGIEGPRLASTGGPRCRRAITEVTSARRTRRRVALHPRTTRYAVVPNRKALIDGDGSRGSSGLASARPRGPKSISWRRRLRGSHATCAASASRPVQRNWV